MKNGESKALPVLAFMGGTKAMTLTPVVGTPRRECCRIRDGAGEGR
jgi:hypothetical protein